MIQNKYTMNYYNIYIQKYRNEKIWGICLQKPINKFLSFEIFAIEVSENIKKLIRKYVIKTSKKSPLYVMSNVSFKRQILAVEDGGHIFFFFLLHYQFLQQQQNLHIYITNKTWELDKTMIKG